MLTYKRKSEKEQTIDRNIEKLSDLVYHQAVINEAFWELTQEIGFVKTDVLQLESKEFFEKLIQNQWSWTQLEQLADLFAQISQQPQQEIYKTKARELLEYIQAESKAFSLSIAQKIEQLKHTL